jgi:cysteine desulfuration protein SufE
VTSSILTREEEVITQFSAIKDWEDKYRKIIDFGKSLEAFPEEHRLEQNKVKGCQSQVWLVSQLSGDRIVFLADSDASIVKGLVAILLKVYSQSTPAEILAFKPRFIDEIGLRQHLSMSRANGLNAMLKQIQFYAIAFGHKLKLQQ